LSATHTREKINLKLRCYREASDNLYVAVINPKAFYRDARENAGMAANDQ
jgi:hypothetical protein